MVLLSCLPEDFAISYRLKSHPQDLSAKDEMLLPTDTLSTRLMDTDFQADTTETTADCSSGLGQDSQDSFLV